MKATGIVRRIDDLGRRRHPQRDSTNFAHSRRGSTGDLCRSRRRSHPQKVLADRGTGRVCPGVRRLAQPSTGHIAIITDRDAVVAVAGAPRKQWMDREVIPEIERSMESRKAFMLPKGREGSARGRGRGVGVHSCRSLPRLSPKGTRLEPSCSARPMRELKWVSWSRSWPRPPQGSWPSRWSRSAMDVKRSGHAESEPGAGLYLGQSGRSFAAADAVAVLFLLLGFIPKGVHFSRASASRGSPPTRPPAARCSESGRRIAGRPPERPSDRCRGTERR